MLYYLLYHVLQRYFSRSTFSATSPCARLCELDGDVSCPVFGPWLIRKLRELQIGQFTAKKGRRTQEKSWHSDDGWSVDRSFHGRPVVLWADLANPFVLIALFALLAFAGIVH